MRHNAAGEPLTLELMSTAGNRTRELVEQVLQSQWQRLGIDVRIRNEPARVFFGETVAKRKFNAMAMFAWISSPKTCRAAPCIRRRFRPRRMAGPARTPPATGIPKWTG